MSPLVPGAADAVVAGVGVLQDQVDEWRGPQLVGKSPGLGLVEPHQRRVQYEGSIHAEVEGHLQRLDRIVATVGIAGEIGLAHAADQVADVAPPGDGGGEGEEQEIAAGHEAVGQPVLLHGEGDVPGQRRITDLSQHAHVDEMVLAQPLRPVRKALPDLVEDDETLIQLDAVALAVVESDRLDMRKSL